MIKCHFYEIINRNEIHVHTLFKTKKTNTNRLLNAVGLDNLIIYISCPTSGTPNLYFSLVCVFCLILVHYMFQSFV